MADFLFPALAALTIFPATMQQHFGVAFKLDGILIESVTPAPGSKTSHFMDEDTNRAITIISERSFAFEFKSKKTSRVDGISRAHAGCVIDQSSLPAMTADLLQGMPVTMAGRVIYLDDPKVALNRAEPDQFDFKLDTTGISLPRFAA